MCKKYLKLSKDEIDLDEYEKIKKILTNKFEVINRYSLLSTPFSNRWIESSDSSFAVFYVPDKSRISKDLFLLSGSFHLFTLGVMDRPRRHAEFDEGYLVVSTGEYGSLVRDKVLTDASYWPNLKKKIDFIWEKSENSINELTKLLNKGRLTKDNFQEVFEPLFIFWCLGLDTRIRLSNLVEIVDDAFPNEELKRNEIISQLLFPSKAIPWIFLVKFLTFAYLWEIRNGNNIPNNYYSINIGSFFRSDILPSEEESSKKIKEVINVYDSYNNIDLVRERLNIKSDIEQARHKSKKAKSLILKSLTLKKRVVAEKYIDFYISALDYNEFQRVCRTRLFVAFEKILDNEGKDKMNTSLSSLIRMDQLTEAISRFIHFP